MNLQRCRQAGFTIAELLIGTGMTGMVLVALMIGATTLQRNFAAATQYAEAQTEQVRVLDFIETDLRRATAITLSTGSTPLTLTLPNYYDTVGGRKVPRLPTKSGKKIQYGAGTVAVSYSLQGNRLIRTEGGVGTTIASSVQTFPAPVRVGNTITTTVTFNTKLKRNSQAESMSLSSTCLLRNVK